MQALPIHPTSSGNCMHTEEGGGHWKLEDVWTGTVLWTGRSGNHVLCGRRWKETACRVSSCQCPGPVTCGHSLTEERGDTWVLSLETKRKCWSGLGGAKGVPSVSLCKTQWTKYLDVWKETFAFCPWRRWGLRVTGLNSARWVSILRPLSSFASLKLGSRSYLCHLTECPRQRWLWLCLCAVTHNSI